MANKAKDLASGTLSSSISASSTSISVSCGSGSDLALLAVWPTTPFYITVMPANPSASVPNSLDSEVMRVSALNANDGIVNMAVSRGQRGTTAKAFSAGDIVSHAVYAEDAVLLGEESSSETPSPWITPDMMTDEAKREIAEDTAVLGYINYTRATLPSGWFPVYKDNAFTITYPYEEIYSAVEAGLSVVFRTTDNYDMRILGLFSTTTDADYYTVAYDGNTLGMLTYDKSVRLTWHYGAGAVLADEIADGAITTTKIADGQITSSKLKGWSTANTTDEWVPVATSNYELQHRLIKPFNADGTIPTSAIANSAVTSAKIDWTTTSIASAPTIISTTTDYITLNSGYSISYNNVYTLGKIVIMNLMIKSDSGYPNGSQVKVGTLTSAFKPAYNNINTYVGLGSEWDCPEIGYCYISANGDMHIRSNTAGKNFARLNIVYVRV